MAWLSDFSDDSAYLQYFRNPGSGTYAVLVYTQIHRLFVAPHSTAHNRGRAETFTKRELAVNTLRKVKSVLSTLSNTRFVEITKSSQDSVWLTI
jgi:hypothetical protein